MWPAIFFPLQLGLLCPPHQGTWRRAMEIAHLYSLLATARCWFARPICHSHGHSLQVKMEWYCVQVGCLFLDGCRHHPATNETTVEGTEPLRTKTSAGQRSTGDQRHTFRGTLHVEGGRNSYGDCGHGSPTVLKTGIKQQTLLQTEQQETYCVRAAKIIAGIQTPVLPITSSECKRKERWDGEEGVQGKCLCSFT